MAISCPASSWLMASTCLLFQTLCSAERVGDEWTTTRGDGTPNLRYSLATVTSSGRIIGLNRNGAIMYSDDNGGSWKYDHVEIGGIPVRGVFSDLYQIPGGNLMAVVKKLEKSNVGYFDYYVRTYLLSSSNNGNAWNMEAFPVNYAEFSGSGHRYYGVDITGLTMGPGNELLAYGTTTGTNNPGFVYWSIGGAIFRKSGNTWVQAHFGYGPVAKVTDAGGRAVAVSHNAILDSADGAGWNGYVIGRGQINLDGNQMDAKTRARLRVIDVEVLGSDYIAEGATFVPYGDSGYIDSSTIDNTYLMSSTAPFAGSRLWNASSEPYRGYFTKLGSNIVALGTGDAYVNSGSGFSVAQQDVFAAGAAIGKASSTTAYITESSETVWKTTNSGAAWTKIWDKDVGPYLRLLGAYGGNVYATDFNDLWVSHDLGESWQVAVEGINVYGSLIVDQNGSLTLPANGGKSFYRSDDNGATWTNKTINIDKAFTGYLMKRSATGRLVLPARGADIYNHGVFYVSDDDGATWQPKVVGLAWGETPGAFTQTKSGRLIASSNTFAVFYPKLYSSDDDGETWTSSAVLQSLNGLDLISGSQTDTAISIKKLVASSTGRVLALGDDELLTSDDDGATWTVRANLEADNPEAFYAYEIKDVIQADKRWVAIGSYRTPYPQSRNKIFLLISDDDGATWGQRPFETSQDNTFLQTLAVDSTSGRLLISGQNASIFVSDPAPVVASSAPTLFVREGRVETVSIERPDVDGAIEASYVLQQQTALVGTDFKAGGGVINWAADDTSDKQIAIETIDNNAIDGDRQLLMQLVFETSDDFVGTIETPIAILDDDAGAEAGLVFENADQLYTTEAGGFAELKLALETKPTANVSITVAGLDTTEGELSAKTFTFTTASWNQLQTLTITGIDDQYPDGDASYELQFLISSNDSSYDTLHATKVVVTNTGDEAYQVGGEMIDSIVDEFKGRAFRISRDGTLTFTVPSAVTGLTFVSEVSSDLKNWQQGPTPAMQSTEDGLTTYKLTLPNASPASFARIHFTLDLVE